MGQVDQAVPPLWSNAWWYMGLDGADVASACYIRYGIQGCVILPSQDRGHRDNAEDDETTQCVPPLSIAFMILATASVLYASTAPAARGRSTPKT